MALDAYASCPCGSGKKFKWCCQPIHDEIDQAFRQQNDGQHEAALRTMQAVVAAHSGNPEAWGRQAQLLQLNGRTEEAEAALEKAFAINPNYAFGFLLRGMMRQREGELLGALLLYRKAVELYDPDAHDQLAYLFQMIGDIELRRNRPVAAREALRHAVELDPSHEELRQGFDGLFGDESRLPLSARQVYELLPLAGDGPARQATTAATQGRFGEAQRLLEQRTRQNEGDGAAWYDLGLVRAWLGDNGAALEALNRYVAAEPDEARAAQAWALGEVLRCGQGMEAEADYREHRRLFRIRDAQPIVALLQRWEQGRRLAGMRQDPEQGVLSGLVLEEVQSLIVSEGPTVARLGAYLLIVRDQLRLTHPNAETLDRIAAEVRQAAGLGLEGPASEVGAVQFGDVVAEALAFPTRATSAAEVEGKMREQAQRYFEEVWTHRPLRSLGGSPPIDAPGHPVLRKKLVGAIQFLEECLTGSAPRLQQDDQSEPMPLYDFDRLRHKLGLGEGAPPPSATAVAAAPAGPDFDAMSAADLAGVGVATLDDEQLERAMRAARKLDARELAGRFAGALVARAPNAERPDRFPAYSLLVESALSEGDTAAALHVLEEAEKADAAANENRRRDEYVLRRAQVHARRGEADAAADLFGQLIERGPAELRYRGSAAEAMLGQKQAGRALAFAEGGLAKAREQNNRDSEQYFLELVAAAKKQGG